MVKSEAAKMMESSCFGVESTLVRNEQYRLAYVYRQENVNYLFVQDVNIVTLCCSKLL